MAARRARISAWFCTLLGGASVGAGVFLLAQVQFALYVRGEVHELGFLRRFLGRATFLWRDKTEKLSLAISELPESAFETSERVGWLLILLGCPVLTPLLSRFLGRRRSR